MQLKLLLILLNPPVRLLDLLLSDFGRLPMAPCPIICIGLFLSKIKYLYKLYEIKELDELLDLDTNTCINLPCLEGLFPRASSLLDSTDLVEEFLDFFSERLFSFLLDPIALVIELLFPPPIELLDFLVLILFDFLL